MTSLSRRKALAATAIALLGVSGCTAGGAPTPSTLTNLLGLIAAGAAALKPVVGTIPGLSPTDVASLEGTLTQVLADAQAVAGSVPTATPTTTIGWVQAVENVVNVVAGLAPATAAYAPIIAALEGLIPVVLADLGVASARRSATPGVIRPMAADDAVRALRALKRAVR